MSDFSLVNDTGIADNSPAASESTDKTSGVVVPGFGYTPKHPVAIENIGTLNVSIEKELFCGAGTNIQTLYLTQGDNTKIGETGEYLNQNHLAEYSRGYRVKIIGTLNDKLIKRSKLKVNPIVLGHFLPHDAKLGADTELDLDNEPSYNNWKLEYISFHYLEAKDLGGGDYSFNLRELHVSRLYLPTDNFVVPNTLSNVSVSVASKEFDISAGKLNDGTSVPGIAPGFNITIAQTNVANGHLFLNTWGFDACEFEMYSLSSGTEPQYLGRGVQVFKPGTPKLVPYYAITGNTPTSKNKVVGMISDGSTGRGYTQPIDLQTNIDLEKISTNLGRSYYTDSDPTPIVTTNMTPLVDRRMDLTDDLTEQSHSKDDITTVRHLVVITGIFNVYPTIWTLIIDSKGRTILGSETKIVKDNNFKIGTVVHGAEVDCRLIVGGTLDAIDVDDNSDTFTSLTELGYPISTQNVQTYLFAAATYINYNFPAVSGFSNDPKYIQFTTQPIYITVTGGKYTNILNYSTKQAIDPIPNLPNLTCGRAMTTMEGYYDYPVGKPSFATYIPTSFGLRLTLKPGIENLKGTNLSTITENTKIKVNRYKGGMLEYPVASGSDITGFLPFFTCRPAAKQVTLVQGTSGIEFGSPNLMIFKNKNTADPNNSNGPVILQHIPFVNRVGGTKNGMLFAGHYVSRKGSGLHGYLVEDNIISKPNITLFDYVEMFNPSVMMESNVPEYQPNNNPMTIDTSTQYVQRHRDGYRCRTYVTTLNEDAGSGICTNLVDSISTIKAKAEDQMGYELSNINHHLTKTAYSLNSLDSQSKLEVVDFYRINNLRIDSDENTIQDNYVLLHKVRNANTLKFSTFITGNTEPKVTSIDIPGDINGISKYNCSFVTLGDKNSNINNILSSWERCLYLTKGIEYTDQGVVYDFLNSNSSLIALKGFNPDNILNVGAFVYMTKPTTGGITDVNIFVIPLLVLKDRGIEFISTPIKLSHSVETDISNISPITNKPIESRLQAFIQLADIADLDRVTPVKFINSDGKNTFRFNYPYLDIFYSRNHAGDTKTSSTLLYYTRTTNLFAKHLKTGTNADQAITNPVLNTTYQYSNAQKKAIEGITKFSNTTYRLTTAKEDKYKYEKMTVAAVGPKNYYMTYLSRRTISNPARIKATVMGRSIFAPGHALAIDVEQEILFGVDPRYSPTIKLLDVPEEIAGSSLFYTADASKYFRPHLVVAAPTNTAFEDLANPNLLDNNTGRIVARFILGKFTKSKIQSPLIGIPI